MEPHDWDRIRKGYEKLLPDIMRASAEGRRISPYFVMDTDWMSLFTAIEQQAWITIRGRGVALYPQFPVLDYFVDFANPFHRIGLELDGAQWHEEDKDTARDERLAWHGWRIFRVPGREAFKSWKDRDDFQFGQRGSKEYEDAVRSWLHDTSDGVIYALDAVYFRRQQKDDLYGEFLETLNRHRLARFPIDPAEPWRNDEPWQNQF